MTASSVPIAPSAGQVMLGDHVGDADPPAQDAEHLGQHGGFVGGEVDPAVGDR